MKPRALLALLVCLLPLTACSPSPQNNTQSSTQPNTSAPAAQQGSARPPYTTHSNRAVPQAATGSFDLYLLTLSWSPEFCQTHPTAPECALHAAFVVHGLWPENANGTYPSHCSNAPGPQDPSQYSDLYPDLGLLQHEWQTHGTCSGLAPDAYFQTIRSAYKSVTIPPALAHLTAQTSLTPAQIQADFTTSNAAIPKSSLIISCGNNVLTAVEVCLDKSLHPTACPTAIRSCHANIVRIPAP